MFFPGFRNAINKNLAATFYIVLEHQVIRNFVFRTNSNESEVSSDRKSSILLTGVATIEALDSKRRCRGGGQTPSSFRFYSARSGFLT